MDTTKIKKKLENLKTKIKNPSSSNSSSCRSSLSCENEELENNQWLICYYSGCVFCTTSREEYSHHILKH